MLSTGSITQMLDQLKQGEQDNAQELWERYFRRLVGLARKKLGTLPRYAPVDGEDVALSAFASFFRGVEKGHFPQLADREGLWDLLMLITSRKAYDQHEYWSRDKRDWRRVQQEPVNPGTPRNWEDSPLAELLSQDPDPAFAAEVAEQCDRLFDALEDEELRKIALAKMEGYINEEIAVRVGCALSTVERRLRLIRTRWEKELAAVSGESNEECP